MKTNKQILQEAKQLIERGWAQGEEATDRFGWTTSPQSQNATCFCTLGAIKRAAFECYPDQTTLRFKTTETAIVTMADVIYPYTSIPIFNDHPLTTKEMVLEMFDKAIAEA